MPLLTFQNLSKAFGAQVCFEKASGQIGERDRIGLIGANGEGKSTLTRVLLGEMKPDDGVVRTPTGLRMAVLTQDPALDASLTLRDEVLSAFAAVAALEHQIHEKSERMAAPDCSPEEMEQLLEDVGQLQAEFEALDGYTIDTQVDSVLFGVGFGKEDFTKPVSGLSGGERSRVALCKVLLGKPDLIVLDEPTNHLDIWGVEWLERFLTDEFDGAALIVSHDRYFLDQVTTRTFELERGVLTVYEGNYTKSRQLKAERIERQYREFQQQQQMIAKQEDFIRKNMAGQRSREAKGRLKRLERFKKDESVDRPNAPKRQMNLQLTTEQRTGAEVITTKDLRFGYVDQKPLFDGVDLEVQPFEVLGIIGPNGAGKSTFLRCLTGEVTPQQGSVKRGVTIVSQTLDQREFFEDESQTILDHVHRTYDKRTEQQIREVLGSLLFPGDLVRKKLGVLSGGEKKRVALAKLLLADANLLFLDEPTNHLDLPSREALEDALEGYSGTIILISHDRYLLDKLCDRILWLSPKGGWAVPTRTEAQPEHRVLWGNYSDFVATIRRERAEARRGTSASKQGAGPSGGETTANGASSAKGSGAGGRSGSGAEKQRSRSKKRTFKGSVAELEQRIEALQEEILDVEMQLGNPETYNDPGQLSSLTERYEARKAELETLEEEWLERAE